MLKRICIILILLLGSQVCVSEVSGDHLYFNTMPLKDAVKSLANVLHLNIVVADDVVGSVTLNLHDHIDEKLFTDFLALHELEQRRLGSLRLITSHAKLIKNAEQRLKWHRAEESVLPLKEVVWRLHYASADDLINLLQKNEGRYLSARGYVFADKRTNSLCLVDVSPRIKKMQHLVERLDVPVQQIMIDARLASVDIDKEEELGFDFAVGSANKVAGTGYSLAIAKLANQDWLDIQLAAMEREGYAELISRPKLFTVNQQVASIEAGEEVPYQEVSEGGGTAIAFKKAVLGLQITPMLLPDNKIKLQIQLSQDRPSQKLVKGVPTISTRRITTNVMLKDGQTLVLGGIYESSKEEGRKRIPILGDLPVLGGVFRVERVRRSKRELLVFVTPRVMI